MCSYTATYNHSQSVSQAKLPNIQPSQRISSFDKGPVNQHGEVNIGLAPLQPQMHINIKSQKSV